jgi:ribonuclease HIII
LSIIITAFDFTSYSSQKLDTQLQRIGKNQTVNNRTKQIWVANVKTQAFQLEGGDEEVEGDFFFNIFLFLSFIFNFLKFLII